jgi:hypothetical protein
MRPRVEGKSYARIGWAKQSWDGLKAVPYRGLRLLYRKEDVGKSSIRQ